MCPRTQFGPWWVTENCLSYTGLSGCLKAQINHSNFLRLICHSIEFSFNIIHKFKFDMTFVIFSLFCIDTSLVGSLFVICADKFHVSHSYYRTTLELKTPVWFLREITDNFLMFCSCAKASLRSSTSRILHASITTTLFHSKVGEQINLRNTLSIYLRVVVYWFRLVLTSGHTFWGNIRTANCFFSNTSYSL